MHTGLTTLALALLGVAGLAPLARTQNPTDNLLSSVEEIQSDFKSVPCKRQERLPAVRALFEKMGAKPEQITSTKQGNVENLVVRRSAAGTDTVVLGAHYDFISAGCGVVDNWSGIVTLAHLFRTIGKVTPRKNIVFVAFDREEEGLFGSRQMARDIRKEDVSDYCAMINIDSFGLAGPFALSNSSSPSLVQLSEQMAEAMKLPFYKVVLDNADADSSSFVAKGIPAVTLSGLSKDWESILHSKNDQAEKIQPVSVYLGYRLALALWDRIDQMPCDAFRKPVK